MRSQMFAGLLALSVMIGSGCAYFGNNGCGGIPHDGQGSCPVCNSHYGVMSFDQDGKPVTWNTWHVCPDCMTDVAAVTKGGKTAHHCLNRTRKTDSCPSCKGS